MIHLNVRHLKKNDAIFCRFFLNHNIERSFCPGVFYLHPTIYICNFLFAICKQFNVNCLLLTEHYLLPSSPLSKLPVDIFNDLIYGLFGFRQGPE